MRRLIIVALVLIMTAGTVQVQAQGDSVEKDLETLALQVHQHNLRTGDFTVWTGGQMGDPSRGLAPTFKLGTKLTDWTLPSFDPKQPSFAGTDFKRPTLVNIWASWCWPCVQEFPDMIDIALHPEKHAYDVVFVDANEAPADAKNFVDQLPSGLRILDDPSGTLLNTVGSPGIPTSILFDKDGTVLAIQVGSYTPAHERFFDMIAQHPGVGHFDAADHPDVQPIAELPPISADEAAPITPGHKVSGTIDDATILHVYSFEGKAGDKLTIHMEMTGNGTGPDELLEPYLVLFDEAGNRVAESTSYAYESYAEIKTTLDAHGVYLIVATRFLEADGLSAGPYDLTLTVR